MVASIVTNLHILADLTDNFHPHHLPEETCFLSSRPAPCQVRCLVLWHTPQQRNHTPCDGVPPRGWQAWVFLTFKDVWHLWHPYPSSLPLNIFPKSQVCLGVPPHLWRNRPPQPRLVPTCFVYTRIRNITQLSFHPTKAPIWFTNSVKSLWTAHLTSPTANSVLMDFVVLPDPGSSFL